MLSTFAGRTSAARVATTAATRWAGPTSGDPVALPLHVPNGGPPARTALQQEGHLGRGAVLYKERRGDRLRVRQFVTRTWSSPILVWVLAVKSILMTPFSPPPAHVTSQYEVAPIG